MKYVILCLVSLLLFFSTKTLAATRTRRKCDPTTQEEASGNNLASADDDDVLIENTSSQIDLSNTYTRPAETCSYATQHPANSGDINQPTPEEKRKAKETLIVAEVGGGLAYTANVYVLNALLVATNPEIAAGVISVLAAVKVVGFAYCAYSWFTT